MYHTSKYNTFYSSIDYWSNQEVTENGKHRKIHSTFARHIRAEMIIMYLLDRQKVHFLSCFSDTQKDIFPILFLGQPSSKLEITKRPDNVRL